VKVNLINIRGYTNDDYIYVGRPSRYGNPYSSKEDSLGEYVGTKDEAINRYEKYIDENDHLIDELISELKEKNTNKIGCWCSPSRCHGDVLKQRIELRGYESII